MKLLIGSNISLPFYIPIPNILRLYLLHSKSQVFSVFTCFKQYVENQTNDKIKFIKLIMVRSL